MKTFDFKMLTEGQIHNLNQRKSGVTQEQWIEELEKTLLTICHYIDLRYENGETIDYANSHINCCRLASQALFNKRTEHETRSRLPDGITEPFLITDK